MTLRIEQIFGIPSEENMDVMDALLDSTIKFVHHPLRARRTLEVVAPYDRSPLATVDAASNAAVAQALATAYGLYRDRDACLSLAKRIEVLERTAGIVRRQGNARSKGSPRRRQAAHRFPRWRANALPFAFQAAVFTCDIDTIVRAYTRLHASAVMVNEHTAFRVDWMPFGGLKQSALSVGGIP